MEKNYCKILSLGPGQGRAEPGSGLPAGAPGNDDNDGVVTMIMMMMMMTMMMMMMTVMPGRPGGHDQLPGQPRG